MRQLDWQVFVETLGRLGWGVIRSDDYHVVVARPVTTIAPVRKMSPLSVAYQRDVLRKLGITEGDFLAELARS